MNGEMISYRCLRTEWETARLLLGLNLPIGLAELSMDADTCQAAYDSLCEAGLLSPSGDTVIVDRLFAFLLTQASLADLALLLHDENRQVLLYRAPELTLLSEWTPLYCKWTPLPTVTAAQAPLYALLRRCKAPVNMELLQGGAVLQAATADSPDIFRETLDKLYNAFCVKTIA